MAREAAGVVAHDEDFPGIWRGFRCGATRLLGGPGRRDEPVIARQQRGEAGGGGQGAASARMLAASLLTVVVAPARQSGEVAQVLRERGHDPVAVRRGAGIGGAAGHQAGTVVGEHEVAVALGEGGLGLAAHVVEAVPFGAEAEAFEQAEAGCDAGKAGRGAGGRARGTGAAPSGAARPAKWTESGTSAMASVARKGRAGRARKSGPSMAEKSTWGTTLASAAKPRGRSTAGVSGPMP